MSFMKKIVGNTPERDGQDLELEPELDEALRDFRLSVHAWSDAAYSRPRTAFVDSTRRRVWRLAVGWALGCVLVAGGVSGGVWQHHQQEMRLAAVRAAEHERLATEQRSQQVRQEDEDLLAKVDSDISREIPSAMEPLAQLMAEDESW
jgi:hypothetical protein